jgi:N-acetylglucosamine-6-phosphate deacetylase
MLRLALRGRGRPILVTDAMPPVGGTSTMFKLNGESIAVGDGRCARQDGRLAGACLDMATAVRNCVRLLDVSLTEALCFAATNPAQFLGLGDQLGRLAPGLRADMVAIDPATIEVHHTWVAGEVK